jgi:Zn finger protein HypA/HybF involved in hydrogenase expression
MMPKKRTLAEFIADAQLIHGNKFNYSKSTYVDGKTKILVTCSDCQNDIERLPGNHLSRLRHGCPYCSGKAKKTTSQFIAEAIAVHGYAYDYSKTDYRNAKTKIRIICNSCKHEFEQLPTNHIRFSHGCPQCFGSVLKTTSQFIAEAIAVHGYAYDYSKTNYSNAQSSVVIVCNTCHRDFHQLPGHHVRNRSGCPHCAGNAPKKTSEFIAEAVNVHGNLYDYSKVDYKNCDTKVVIMCKSCQRYFEQTPNVHITDECGCPYCASFRKSKGEKRVSDLLGRLGISYEIQKRFAECIADRPLPFDFYLPSYNTLIEYDGEHHFRPTTYGGCNMDVAIDHFEKTQRNDIIKNQFAKCTGINLIRIPCTVIDIDSFLLQKLSEILAI